MPLYTYVCPSCQHVFDFEKGIHDPHPVKCPECGKKKLQRRFYPLAVRYRCSGFNATDKALDTPVPGYDGPDEDDLL